MVLDHVAQRARLLVVGAARLHADRLADGDLHVVDVVPVPERLEDAVGPAEHQDVLHRLLAEVVIDAVDLILREHRAHRVVQRAGRREIAPERLLDDDAHPAAGAVGRPVEPGFAEPEHDRRVERGRGGAVEEPVAADRPLLLDLAQEIAEPGVEVGVGGIAGVVEEGLGEPLPHARGGRLDAGELRDRLAHARAELLVAHLRPAHADDGEGLGQHAALEHRPERGDELALGEIAGGAEDDEDAGVFRRYLCHGALDAVLTAGELPRARAAGVVGELGLASPATGSVPRGARPSRGHRNRPAPVRP